MKQSKMVEVNQNRYIYISKSYINDGFGNKFNSNVELCLFYNIPLASLHGVSCDDEELVKSTILQCRNSKNGSLRTVYDHKGKEYPSIDDMCLAYNHMITTIYSRLSNGWTLKSALETGLLKDKAGIKCKDCKGNVFNSYAELCRHWNTSAHKLRYMIEKGYTTEEYTEMLVNKTNIPDSWVKQLRKKYPTSYKAILAKCTVSYATVASRVKKKWDIVDAVVTPALRSGVKTVKINYIDPDGEIFHSFKDLCKKWHKSYVTVKEKMNKGMDLHEILLEKKSSYIDHRGNKYKSIDSMCKTYNVSVSTYQYRITVCGFTTEEALEYDKICMYKNKRITIPNKNSRQWKQDLWELCNHNVFQYICIYKHMQVSEVAVKYRLKTMSLLNAIMTPSKIQ